MDIERLKKAVIKLVEADVLYEELCIEKYGSYKEDNDIYLQCMDGVWEEYLNAGGSRTMINNVLDKEYDYGGVHKKLDNANLVWGCFSSDCYNLPRIEVARRLVRTYDAYNDALRYCNNQLKENSAIHLTIFRKDHNIEQEVIQLNE